MQQKYFNAACASTQALSWLNRNAPLAGDLRDIAPRLRLDLARSTNALRVGAAQLTENPTLGLFGASQAGKSYLVSVLAAGRSQKLVTHWDEHEIDFLKHVNPSGNNSEATGFVTRFSHKVHSTPQGYPVELALLQESELVMILVNAFFNDINPGDVKAYHDEEAFIEHLQSCMHYVDNEARAQVLHDKHVAEGAQAQEETLNAHGVKLLNGEYNYLSFADVIALGDYCSAHSKGKLPSINEWPRFWTMLGEMLPFMPLDGRVEALSILWQKLPIFSETYRHLAQELLKVKGRSVLYAPISAFVTEDADHGLMQNASGTVMHITKLSTMFSDSTVLQCSLGKDLGTVELTASVIAALSRELRFNLEGSGLLDDFDVLDLPGARSRDVVILKDVIDDGASFELGEPLDENMQKRGTEFFRRGKVAFLFDRCALTREMEQLLFCIGVNAQQDVTDVLTILSDWIELNIGASPAERSSSYNPLTIVFTRYDEVFNRQMLNIDRGLPMDMQQEVNIALNRIQKLNWFNEWTPGRPFSRVFMARRPCLGDINPWMDYEEGTLRETGVKEEDAEKIASIVEKLKTVGDLTIHVPDIDAALEAVLSLNDGGVTVLAQSIREGALSHERSLEQRIQKAKKQSLACYQDLAPFAQLQSALALEKASEEAKELGLNLMQCNTMCPCLYLLRPLLEFPIEELNVIYSDGFSAGSNVQRFVRAVINKYMEFVYNYTKPDNPKLLAIAEKVTRSYSERLSSLRSLGLEKTEKYFSFCLDKTTRDFKTPDEMKKDVMALFNKMFREIAKTFTSPQINLEQYLSQNLLACENVNEGLEDVRGLQVQTMAFLLSDFNLYLGSNLLPASSVEDVSIEEESEDDPFDDLKPKKCVNCVLGTEGGPVNSLDHRGEYVLLNERQKRYDLFDYSCPTDSTSILPHLNEESADYEFRFISDWCSALMFMMCHVNALAANKYTFASDENLLLCQLLEALKLNS